MGIRDDEFWAGFLGIEPPCWTTPGISYRPHVGLAGYSGFWCFRRLDRVVVSAPPSWLSRLQETFAGWDGERLSDPASLASALGAVHQRVIGPVFQGCLEPEHFVSRPVQGVRKLGSADAAKLQEFRAECGTEDWQSSGLERAEAAMQAHFEAEKITALAGYRAWSDTVGDLCLLAHPDFRGRGRAVAAASAIVAEASSRGRLVLFQTLESNQAALRTARALGFERYASHVAVRLRPEAPEL